MKYIFKDVIIYELNGMTVKRSPYNWHYGEIPADEKVSYTFDEVPVLWGDFETNYTIFTNRRKSVCLQGGNTNVSRKNFISASETITSFIIDDSKVCTADLLRRLSASDFVAWCKDNGITAIPVLTS